VDVVDFARLLQNPPLVDRASLKWDNRLLSKELIMQWTKKGYQGWYQEKIVAYDEDTQEHTIEWLEDDSRDSVVDLMCCKMCKEWRLVQEDEDVKENLRNLNGDVGEEESPHTANWKF
jgi:hypothetical protein